MPNIFFFYSWFKSDTDLDVYLNLKYKDKYCWKRERCKGWVHCAIYSGPKASGLSKAFSFFLQWNKIVTAVLSISSVQFSRSVVSDSLRPHESQHTRPPCPSPTPGVHSDSRPLSQWCHPAISSSVVPFSSCPQSLPASESFPMSQLFAWGGQSTGVSALASFLPKKS